MSVLHVTGSIVPVAALEMDDPPEVETYCCAGAACMGRDRCTCWAPTYDVEQEPLGQAPAEVPTRAKCCHDCAYRAGSPERKAQDGHPFVSLGEFWCHHGMRRAVSYRHAESGRVVPAGPGDYHPPIGPNGQGERPLAWRADGTVGERCAGWAMTQGGRR